MRFITVSKSDAGNMKNAQPKVSSWKKNMLDKIIVRHLGNKTMDLSGTS